MSDATLNGQVQPNELDCTVHFEYGLDTSYGTSTTGQDIPAGNELVAFTDTITGLDPDTTYHYRSVVSNANGHLNGGDKTFHTALPLVKFIDSDGVGYDEFGAVVASGYTPAARDSTYSYTPNPQQNLAFGLGATLIGPALSMDIRNEFGAGWYTDLVSGGKKVFNSVPMVAFQNSADNTASAGTRGYGTFNANGTLVGHAQPPGWTGRVGADQRSTVVARGAGASSGILLGVEFIAWKEASGEPFSPEQWPGVPTGSAVFVARDVTTGAMLFADANAVSWVIDGIFPVLDTEMSDMGMSTTHGYQEVHITPMSDGTFWFSPVQSAALSGGALFKMIHLAWDPTYTTFRPVPAGTGDVNLSITGTYGAPTVPITIEAEITASGSPDTFKYRVNGGSYVTGVSCSTSPIAITGASALSFVFGSATGHNVGDQWYIKGSPSLTVTERVTLSVPTFGSARFAKAVY